MPRRSSKAEFEQIHKRNNFMPKQYKDRLTAIRKMIADPSQEIVQEGYGLLFKLWLENVDNSAFIQELVPIAVEHQQMMQELANRLGELSLRDTITDTFLKKELAKFGSEVDNFKTEAIKTGLQTTGLPPININITENRKTKVAWWQMAFFAVIIISLALILILPQPFQKALVLVVAACGAVFFYYIVPKRDRTISTDLSNIKLSYISPNYLSLGDENTIHISIENPSQTEFNGKITLVFNDPDSLVTPAPDQSLSAKVDVSPLGKEAKQFKFLVLKKPSDGNLNYYFQISSDKSQYVSNEENFQIAPIPYLRSAWAWLFGSAGLGALILALLWDQVEHWLGLK